MNVGVEEERVGEDKRDEIWREIKEMKAWDIKLKGTIDFDAKLYAVQ